MTRNELVTNNNRNIKAIRREIVQAATNFHSERHDSEQDKVISTIKDMFTACSANDFVNAGVNIFVRDCFQKKTNYTFCNESCEQWKIISETETLPAGNDIGCTLFV